MLPTDLRLLADCSAALSQVSDALREVARRNEPEAFDLLLIQAEAHAGMRKLDRLITDATPVETTPTLEA